MAVPHDGPDPVGQEQDTSQYPATLHANAADALARLRGIRDNAELTQRISAELSQVGFTRVFFSRAAAGFGFGPAADCAQQAKSTTRLVAPVWAWRHVVGHLHAVTETPTHEDDQILLRLIAESVGAIFERNVLVERLLSASVSARDYTREIDALADVSGPSTTGA